MAKVHFTGVGGNGMSALAQFHVMSGGDATGSDRFFDHADAPPLRAKLEALGVRIFPQDGSGLDAGTAETIASAAVESGNADLDRARAMRIPIVGRGDALARIAASHRTVSIAGTSGKSSVTAMVFEILAAGGLGPSVLTGGAINSLKAKGLVGNAFKGASDVLVIEADESDGTLTKCPSWIGAMLNLSKDHKELDELAVLFRRFKDRSERFVVSADAANLAPYHDNARTFGFEAGHVRGRDLTFDGKGSSFTVDGVRFALQVPGRYNAENALAAAAVGLEAGVPLATSAEALRAFGGVERRFELVGRARGVEVIDDFAHNPDKVKAAITTARFRGQRVLAVFQFHGFAPARHMKAEFLESFAEALGPKDVLWIPPIYYVGGTTTKDIGPEDFAAPLRAKGHDVRAASDRKAAEAQVAAEARDGDVVLVMGARDPSLGDCARAILAAVQNKTV